MGAGTSLRLSQGVSRQIWQRRNCLDGAWSHGVLSYDLCHARCLQACSDKLAGTSRLVMLHIGERYDVPCLLAVASSSLQDSLEWSAASQY